MISDKLDGMSWEEFTKLIGITVNLFRLLSLSGNGWVSSASSTQILKSIVPLVINLHQSFTYVKHEKSCFGLIFFDFCVCDDY